VERLRGIAAEQASGIWRPWQCAKADRRDSGPGFRRKTIQFTNARTCAAGKLRTARLIAALSACFGVGIPQAYADITATGDVDPVYPNADPWDTDRLYIGRDAAGTLDIFNGGVVNSTDGYLGYNAGAAGIVKVSGPLSQWNIALSNSLYVGDAGSGTLTIQDGGTVNSGGGLIIGEGVSSSALITGEGAAWQLGGNFFLRGDAALTVQDGGALSAGGGGYISGDVNTPAQINITGPGSRWDLGGYLYLGETNDSPAELTITNQARATTGSANIGHYSNSDSSVLVDGDGSAWEVGGNLIVGRSSFGTLVIQDGGVVSVAGVTRMRNDHLGNSGSKIRFDNGTLNTGMLEVNTNALQGEGTINATGVYADFDLVFNPADGPYGRGLIDALPGQHIVVNVDASSGVIPNDMGAGYMGTGSLTVEGGAQIVSDDGFLGYEAGSNGTATISGLGSRWDNVGTLVVGQSGTGTLHVLDGAVVTNDNYGGYIGRNSGSSGTVVVDGFGSLWDARSGLFVGERKSSGTLEIRNAGRVSSALSHIASGSESVGAVTVDGLGSRWDIAGELNVGEDGQGSLNILNGGVVVPDGVVYVGRNRESVGALTIAGPGSQLTAPDDLWV